MGRWRGRKFSRKRAYRSLVIYRVSVQASQPVIEVIENRLEIVSGAFRAGKAMSRIGEVTMLYWHSFAFDDSGKGLALVP